MEAQRPLDRTVATPLHAQLEEIIRDQIDAGAWATNSQIPSENEFSSMYGLSRMTTREVITRLVFEGLLYRVPGKGTFVSSPKIENHPRLPMGIQGQLDTLGVANTTTLLGVERLLASSKVQRSLGLHAGAEVYRVDRSRSLKGDPFSIHHSFVPVSLCPDLDRQDLRGGRLRDVLEQSYNLWTGRIAETVEIALASDELSNSLDVPPGFALLQLEEIMSTEAGVAFEYCRIFYRGDKMKVSFEFQVQEVSAAAP